MGESFDRILRNFDSMIEKIKEQNESERSQSLRHYEESQKEFNELMISINHILIQKGMIVPNNFMAYVLWYFSKNGAKFELDNFKRSPFRLNQNLLFEYSLELTNQLNEQTKELRGLPNDFNSEVEDQGQKTESTPEKMKRILEPLRNAFDAVGHIDKIIEGLIEYESKGVCTVPIRRLTAHYDELINFYEPFVKVWKETGLNPTSIGQVLTRFIFMHNGNRDAIAPGTIRKNIYDCNVKLTKRNRL